MFHRWLILLLAPWLVAPTPVAAAQYDYQIAWQPAPEILEVRVCAPAESDGLRLVAPRRAAEHLIASEDSEGRLIGGVVMGFDGARCGAYRVDLAALADSRRIGRGFRSGGDLLLWQAAWLWWPEDRAAAIELTAALPPGWHLSAPWPRSAGDPARYRLDGWPRAWPGLVALHRQPPRDLVLGEGLARVAVLGAVDAAQRATLLAWVRESATLLAPLTGGLPLPEVQVLVVPIEGGRGPVPWAQVLRAGTGGVHFFVDAARPGEDFRRDWTAPHEFAHLLHPYLGNQGRWMAEGLASYYQNLLRVRAGTWDEAEFWRRLLEGFERGRRGPAQSLPLAQAALEMRARRANMRVYWSGAAYWLRAEVALRRTTAGTLGLDDVLRRFAACCLPATRRWSPEAFAARLDELAGETVFVPLARRAVAERDFPDVAELLGALGVRQDHAGRFAGIDDAAPEADLRRALVMAAANADEGAQAPTPLGPGATAATSMPLLSSPPPDP
jgi:hypothetical protein